MLKSPANVFTIWAVPPTKGPTAENGAPETSPRADAEALDYAVINWVAKNKVWKIIKLAVIVVMLLLNSEVIALLNRCPFEISFEQ